MVDKIEVKQPEGAEIPVEILAQSIVDIAAAVNKIGASRLNRKALLVLLCHDTKLYQHQVEAVLGSLEQLEATYCTPKGKRK